MTPSAPNIHGTLVALDDKGILIVGSSGSGKTELALALLSHWRAQRRFARLVCDDQVLVATHRGRLVGRAPASIAGLAEARSYGIAAIAHEPAAVIDLVVDLVGAKKVARMAEPAAIVLAGTSMPLLRQPCRDTATALIAIAAALGAPPFSEAGDWPFGRGSVAD